ncbi:MAG: TonB-dependent receptor [Alphaproteobacteria bacterium]|nr:MAG: TonB-dependent receptor [Alphaproteobacteria bacterium]
MDFKKHLSATLLATVAVLPVSHAEENFEEIVVSATRYARPLSEIGSSISVISAEDMAKSQTVFVQDILQSIPGLSLNQSGSFGGVASLRIRGAGSDQTVILIDGVQINDVASPGGGFDFSNLDPNGIERIEVLRGPQSILYGSDAIGGVINIITPSGREGLAGSLFAEGGSFGTFRAGGNIAGGNDKLNFSLSGSGITTDGISKADENDGNSEADSYRNISLHGKVTAKISESHSLQLISRYVDSRNEFDGFPPPFFSLSDTDEVSFTEEFLIAGRGFFNYLDGALQNTLSIEYSTTNRRGETDGAPVSFLTFEGSRFNLDYFGHYEVSEDFGISFGLQHEETKAETISPLKFNIDSVFSELSWQGLEGLTLTAGLRYDDHNQYGSTTTPRITGAYYFAESGTKVFANWGEGFKAPSVFQLTFICGFCGLTAPNGNLKAEESEAWEAGFEQALWNDKIHLGATYFKQTITNLIDFDFSIGFGNIANVHTKGVELSLDVQLTESLSISGNYTFTDATDEATGEDLVRVPRNAAFGKIQWQAMQSLSLALSMTYNGKERDPFSPDPDGWVRFDLNATYEIKPGIEIYGRVDNLFDREYQQVSGFGTADRSFYAGVRGKF